MTWAQQEDGHSTSVSRLCVGATAAPNPALRQHVRWRQRQKEETEIASGLLEAQGWVPLAPGSFHHSCSFQASSY